MHISMWNSTNVSTVGWCKEWLIQDSKTGVPRCRCVALSIELQFHPVTILHCGNKKLWLMSLPSNCWNRKEYRTHPTNVFAFGFRLKLWNWLTALKLSFSNRSVKNLRSGHSMIPLVQRQYHCCDAYLLTSLNISYRREHLVDIYQFIRKCSMWTEILQ